MIKRLIFLFALIGFCLSLIDSVPRPVQFLPLPVAILLLAVQIIRELDEPAPIPVQDLIAQEHAALMQRTRTALIANPARFRQLEIYPC